MAVLLLITLVITFAPSVTDLVPTWEKIYEKAGIGADYSTGLPFERMPLTMAVIDVGQGESIFFIDDSGTTFLVDTGIAGSFDKISKILGMFSVREIDYLVISHPHEDHMGAFSEMVRSGKVVIKNIILPRLSPINEPQTEFYKDFLRDMENSKAGITYVSSGYNLSVGRLKFEVLAPGTQREDLNNMSLVTRFSYGQTTFLVMGDAQAEEEREILDFYGQNNMLSYLLCNVLVVGHHGSRDASSPSFVSAVNPKIAVISCGVKNDYGHPHKETLDTLKSVGAKVYRTDNSGDIFIGSDGVDISILN